jgi:chromosome segregation ATPase
MSLKDFRTDPSDLPTDDPDNPAPASLYRDERHSLKLDRLSTRVTIITILLPVLMGVALFFIYLDMKDRVMGMDAVKDSQVDYLSRQMEEKLNALDVRIAKNRFDLDETLPPLEKKTGFLEGQLGKLTASKADLKTLEQEIKTLEEQLTRQDLRIQNNADQHQVNLAEMERINATLLSALSKDRERFENEIRAVKQEAASLDGLKQDVISLQARMDEMDEDRTDLESIQKTVALLERQVGELKNQLMSRTEITRRLMALETEMVETMNSLEKKINTPPLPVPDSISEETLKQ